jgi:hypothetical protein
MAGITKNFDSKADIIQALAASAGATKEDLKKFGESKWDSSTGTYYSNGKMFSKMSIFRAKSYFADQTVKYNKIGTAEAKEMARCYDLAYEAICALEKNKPEDGTNEDGGQQ